MTSVLRPFAALLSAITTFIRFIGELTWLLIDTLWQIPRSLFSKQGRRLGWQNLWTQMNRVGVRSIPIVVLVMFCIGAILA
ncbi:MAG TPA: hypothetical protein VMD30_14220, partial [Tepidisphaeraceae bacterium]|nr:hypothetical protein [Tepidisphaeraceae bacterium]